MFLNVTLKWNYLQWRQSCSIAYCSKCNRLPNQKTEEKEKVKKQQIKARADFVPLSFKNVYAVQCMPKY